MRNYLLLLALTLILIVPMVDASELPPVEKDTCTQLIQTCANCTFVNITTITYPLNSTIQFVNEAMDKYVDTYNYTFCGTSKLGPYQYRTIGDPDGQLSTASIGFSVTPSGAGELTTAQGYAFISALVVIMFLIALFFWLSTQYNNFATKLTFIALGSIMVFIAILYTLLVLNEAVATSPKLVEGFETFYTVMRTVFYILITSLFIAVGYFMWKSARYKRGLD